MRIISGSLKGRRIHPPTRISARPTMDSAREAIFNILTNRLDWQGMKVLDLFAGSGMISYEFASRGVDNVLAIDNDRISTDFIKSTSQKLELPIQVYNVDVFKYLASTQEVFSLVFADPPYALPRLAELPDIILSAGILMNQSMLILEHDHRHQFGDHRYFLEHRKYGSTNFSIFSAPQL